MATASLTIAALEAGGARSVPVSVYLTDSNRSPIAGHVASTGTIIAPFHTRTADDGTLTLALHPNANITPANTYYNVIINGEEFLITKTSSTQTLQAALAVSPVDLTVNPIHSIGTGSPEGVVTATKGSLYTRTDGGANTCLYVKESGSGNTGWVGK